MGEAERQIEDIDQGWSVRLGGKSNDIVHVRLYGVMPCWLDFDLDRNDAAFLAAFLRDDTLDLCLELGGVRCGWLDRRNGTFTIASSDGAAVFDLHKDGAKGLAVGIEILLEVDIDPLAGARCRLNENLRQMFQ